MTRVVFSGGSVFDGTGAMPAAGDVAIEDGRIVDVGLGLDGDERVDVTGKTLLPVCSTATCTSRCATRTSTRRA